MTDWNVGKLLGMSSAYWRGCALQAAVRLQLFTHLGGHNLSGEEIAERADTDPRATGLLLDALAAMGLVVKAEDSYSNTPFGQTHLVKGKPEYLGHIILHHHHILDGWAQLDQAVVTGKKVTRRSYGEELERESFLMGMFNLASQLAPHIAEAFPLPGRKKLLDLGGGPGTYAIQFCLKNQGLEAAVFDRPTTEPFARKTIESFGLSPRIDFFGGDFTSDPVPGGPYDVAWLSHILHSNSAAECQRIIVEAVRVMASGGLIMIHDFILDDTKDGPEFPALFALNMLLGTEQGRSYSRAEIIAMMKQAGVIDIVHHTFRAPNESSIITGTVG